MAPGSREGGREAGPADLWAAPSPPADTKAGQGRVRNVLAGGTAGAMLPGHRRRRKTLPEVAFLRNASLFDAPIN